MQITQNKAKLDKNTDALIGTGLIIEKALIKGSGAIRIDGSLTGTIDIQGRIILGETGVINGDIHADSALLAGKYSGNLNIEGTLHLTATADVTGRIESGKLIVDEGALFDGTFNVPKGTRSKAVEEKPVVIKPPIDPAESKEPGAGE